MATYAVITTTSTSIHVAFNAYAPYSGFVESKWRIEEMVSVYLGYDGTVGVRAKSGMSDYVFSHDGSKGMKVETFNGVTPTSSSHLFELISAVVP